ncbi:MAG: DUF1549 domain-containing protein, partial [Planctomycetia bacterium]|nr:DUF1549 domain-containing protein [Planctomycetia bacterium]
MRSPSTSFPWQAAALLFAVALVVATATARSSEVIDAAAEAVAGDGAEFFERTVRPLLAERCLECHGEMQEGGLRLDSRSAVLAGGDSGPAVVPGDPAASLLVRAIHYTDPAYQMPPAGKLSGRELSVFEEWVRRGLPWPGSDGETAPAPGRAGHGITAADRKRWAYSPVVRPEIPAAAAGTSPIDAFLRRDQQAAGITPNGDASPHELVRRAWFDLVGLPPPLEEVDAFAASPTDAAWEALVDRLLALPAYGERQARHWLDVVRYAQTNGYERDDEKPFAWRYRDWVIEALNADMPYDQFVREQIAGDLLEPRADSGLIASGFWHLGTWDDEPDDARLARFDELDDSLATIGQAFLGSTIGCARCHDHKFDPFSQADYYGLVGLVQGVRRSEKVALPPRPEAAQFVALTAAGEWALAAREAEGATEAPRILVRGNPATPGAAVAPGVPEVFRDRVPTAPGLTGRRWLAEWIASPAHPLTARVAANRIWQRHFGRGLVASPNDFGAAGVPATHPDLLDWLAAELVDSGWSRKRLHRTMMLSRAYRASSRADRPECIAADEANHLLWRQNRRRLEAEAIRDGMLAVSGALRSTGGGRGFFMTVGPDSLAGQSRPGLGWEISSPDEQRRRSIYSFVKRTLLVPELEALDYTNTTSPVGERSVTTVAPQALLMLNGDFARGQAGLLAARVTADLGAAGADPADDDAFVRRLFERALSRRPTSAETAFATSHLARQVAAWSRLDDPIVFRPLVPRALQEGYRGRLAPEQILEVDPAAGWRIGGGVWGGSYEGIVNADPAAGPFALFTGLTPTADGTPAPGFVDGVVEAELFIRDAADVVALVIRGVPTGAPQAERATGYELAVVPRAGTVELRRVAADGVTVLVSRPTELRTDAWNRLRLEVAAGRLAGWLTTVPTEDGVP